MSKSAIRLLKSVAGLWPKSAHMMGHLLPFDLWRSCSRSRNVLLWRLILNLADNLEHPRMCVFVSGELHLVHMMDGLCSLLHL